MGRIQRSRNFYFEEITRVKKEYEDLKYQKLANNKTDSNMWWVLIKQALKNNDHFESIPPLEVDNDIIIADDIGKANAFNDFFSKASNLNDDGATVPENIRLLEDHPLEEIMVSVQDVTDQLKNLDTSKSYGPDEISPKFLKEGCDVLAPVLKKLFELSLNKCIVPRAWKQANVVPIYKKGLRTAIGNYRPVSLLSCMGKTFERIVYKYMYNFFKDNFVLSVNQSGFLPGVSTVTQLLEIYHKFCKAVEDGKEVRVVFLDISKAFDRVWHKGLLYKLRLAGISGKLLSWLHNYLSNRYQRVVVNGLKSDYVEIKAGVPQGSVLGPLLFLVFINDITHVVNHCQLRLFADDTCLFIEVNNRVDTAHKVNADLVSIDNWAKQWLVDFSPTKTKSLTISTKKNADQNPRVYLSGQAIREVDFHLHLGLNIAKNLRWSVHINEICIKARKRLNAMIPLKYKLDKKTLELMYFTLVRPTMEYANVVWGGTYDSNIVKLEQIQIDAMRIVTGATARSNIAKLYEEVAWTKLHDRINNTKVIMVYKLVNNLSSPTLANLILKPEVQERRYEMRRPERLRTYKARLDLFVRSFFNSAIRLWNSLSPVIITSKNLNEFKGHLKKTYPSKNELYYYGERWPAVHHARMRIGCSKLNNDLCHNLHVINSPSCECGSPIEDAHHYFLDCQLYIRQRAALFQILTRTVNVNELTVKIMLFGSPRLSLTQNKSLFYEIHEFIKDTKRFD